MLAVSVGALAAGWQLVPLRVRALEASDSYRIAPQDPDRYPVELEVPMHLTAADPVVRDSMRAADVLILGSSRVMMGLAEAETREFFQARGLRYYYLGFGAGYSAAFFCERVMREQQLAPRWVIVNADGYFRPQPDAPAREELRASRFHWAVERFETEASLAILPSLHRWYPRFPGGRQMLFWRSRTTGSWTARTWFPPGLPFPSASDDDAPIRPAEDKIRRAEEFKMFCDAIGARLVLTHVPTPTPFDARGAGAFLAQHLGVPFSAPVVAGLQSGDDSHLTPESAAAFSRAFFARLPQLVPALATAARAPGE